MSKTSDHTSYVARKGILKVIVMFSGGDSEGSMGDAHVPSWNTNHIFCQY